jgi:hypothetical protein
VSDMSASYGAEPTPVSAATRAHALILVARRNASTKVVR